MQTIGCHTLRAICAPYSSGLNTARDSSICTLYFVTSSVYVVRTLPEESLHLPKLGSIARQPVYLDALYSHLGAISRIQSTSFNSAWFRFSPSLTFGRLTPDRLLFHPKRVSKAVSRLCPKPSFPDDQLLFIVSSPSNETRPSPPSPRSSILPLALALAVYLLSPKPCSIVGEKRRFITEPNHRFRTGQEESKKKKKGTSPNPNNAHTSHRPLPGLYA